MSLLKFPGIFFLEVVPLLFNESALKTMPDTPLYRFEEKTGLHHFVFDGGEWASDSAEELVEIAIREIERSIKALILKNGPRPYVTLQLATDVEGPSVVVCDAFNVLERPWRVEFYVDSFRRGLSKLRVAHGL